MHLFNGNTDIPLVHNVCLKNNYRNSIRFLNPKCMVEFYEKHLKYLVFKDDSYIYHMKCLLFQV